MHQLLRFVAHPAYVEELGTAYHGGKEYLDVHTAERCLLAVLVHGMFRRDVELVHDPKRPGDPHAPRQVLTDQRTPDSGGDLARVVRDVKKFIWDRLRPDREYDDESFRNELRKAAQQRNPWFLPLANDDSIPWGQIASECPKLLLLRVGMPDQRGGICTDTATLGLQLEDLLKLIKEIGGEHV
jgi:hypothetical protein